MIRKQLHFVYSQPGKRVSGTLSLTDFKDITSSVIYHLRAAEFFEIDYKHERVLFLIGKGL